MITFGRQQALVLAGGKRVTITIQASAREHTLITTNPVELAVSASFSFEQGSDIPLSRATQLSQEVSDGTLSYQTTAPLHLLEVQESDEDTVKIRMNHHRQSAQHTIA